MRELETLQEDVAELEQWAEDLRFPPGGVPTLGREMPPAEWAKRQQIRRGIIARLQVLQAELEHLTRLLDETEGSLRAEEVKIESTEYGFDLLIYGDFGDFDHICVNVQSVAVELYNEVVKNIGPWIAEGIQARDEYRTGISGDPLLQGVLDRIRGEDERVESTVGALLEGIDLARKAARENR